MDIHNAIMDIHNYRVYALLVFHMSQLIYIQLLRNIALKYD